MVVAFLPIVQTLPLIRLPKFVIGGFWLALHPLGEPKQDISGDFDRSRDFGGPNSSSFWPGFAAFLAFGLFVIVLAQKAIVWFPAMVFLGDSSYALHILYVPLTFYIKQMPFCYRYPLVVFTFYFLALILVACAVCTCVEPPLSNLIMGRGRAVLA